MFDFKNILTITKKELRGYFDSPTAYIVLVGFLLLWEFLFFQEAFLSEEASLRSFFYLLPWIYLFVVSAITMGSVSEEKKEGTIELLLTHPLRERDLVIGKHKGALTFVFISLLLTLPVAISFEIFGDLDWGALLGQYMASLLLGASLISIGIFVSSLVSNQISSFIITALVGFVLLMAGSTFVTSGIPPFAGHILERLSFASHFDSMSRGVIDLRDVLYFVSLISVFLGLAYLQLLKRRFGNKKGTYAAYQLWLAVFAGVAVILNILGSSVPGRLDLTEGQIYTLSDSTEEIVGNLDRDIEIVLYLSDDLPAQLQPILRDVRDTLRDYETLGAGRLAIIEKNPLKNPEAASEASSREIQEMQFNVVGQEELQVKRGYLGISVVSGEDFESIPYIQGTAALEYQLTSFIKKLSTTDKKTIGFLSGHGEKTLLSDYTLLNKELQNQFVTQSITINEENPEISDVISALVVAGPVSDMDERTSSAIKNYLNKGGSAIFLVDGVNVMVDILDAQKTEQNFSEFLGEFGVNVGDDLVYDLQSRENVNMGSGIFTYIVPYPLWPRVLAEDKNSTITSRIDSIVLPWASSVTLNEEKLKELGLVSTTLFSTTRFGGVQTETFSISPQSQFSETNLGERVVAVALNSADTNASGAFRAIVVGDSDFLSDQFASSVPSNLAFGMEALSWLAQENSLAGIRLKQISDRKLVFEDNTQKMLVKYGNMAFVVMMPLAFGAVRMMRRRNLRKQVYKS